MAPSHKGEQELCLSGAIEQEDLSVQAAELSPVLLRHELCFRVDVQPEPTVPGDQRRCNTLGWQWAKEVQKNSKQWCPRERPGIANFEKRYLRQSDNQVRCFRCLTSGHKVSFCKNDIRCRRCFRSGDLAFRCREKIPAQIYVPKHKLLAQFPAQ